MIPSGLRRPSVWRHAPRSKASSIRKRTPSPRFRHVTAMTAMLVCAPLVAVGAIAGTASASPSGHIHLYKGGGIDLPEAIRVGPDGALWFTNPGTTRSDGSRPRAW